MSWNLQPGNYVKFLRGTPEAWELIKNNASADTLYFISAQGATKGQLYLGAKLISSGETAITSLSDLSDILIENNISNNSFLVYDATNHKWKPQTLDTVLALMQTVMTGATASTDGAKGLVPKPFAGDQDKYLKGDGTWADPTATLTSIVSTLVGNDTGKSVRTIASEEASSAASSAVAALVNNAPSSFDTLKEISDWIQTHQDATDVTLISQRVGNLETLLNGDPDDQTDDGLVGQVENIDLILNGDQNTTGLIEQVGDLDDLLRWQDIIIQND